jgi:predicted dinucleotide-binding enzyme
VKDAVSQAQVIVLAVKYEDAAEALKAAGDLTDKVVIDLQPKFRSLPQVPRS